MPSEYPSILGNSSQPEPPQGPAGPTPTPPAPARTRPWIFVAAFAVLAVVAALLFVFRATPGGGGGESSPATAAPIPAPALIGSFSGTSVAPAGTKSWVVLVVDRIIENEGQNRFHYRMLRGGPGGEDGEGSYDPKSSEIRFGGMEEAYVGRVARESDGRLVIMASDSRRGFAVRLHHD